MKKILLISIFLISFLGFSQNRYRIRTGGGKITGEQIVDSIDVELGSTVWRTDSLGPDGNVGDLTIGGSGTTAIINDDAVTSAKILDGTILNADVNTSAAIAGTKLSNTPAGDIAATTVQGAINEINTEFLARVGGASRPMTGDLYVRNIRAVFDDDAIMGQEFQSFEDGYFNTFNLGNATAVGSQSINLRHTSNTITSLSWDADGIYYGGINLMGGIQEHPDSGLTGIRIGAGTEAQKAAATLDAEDIWISTDATPAETITGTVIDMSGFTYIDDSSVDTATFTLTGAGPGGYAEILINEATEPAITGATQLPNTADFIAATNMLICLKSVGTTVYYFFVELP
jgi:hypothetical protein